MHRGQWVDPAAGRLTLAEWAATYLATVTNLRPTTFATYERDLDRYVLPRFGHLPLAHIRPLDIRTWLADELAAGIAPTSVHRHFCTLRRLLRVAVETDLLVKSPCAGIKPPPVEPQEMRFLTAAEVHRLADEMHPHFRVLVYTAAYAGLRWGELIGLKRARVDVASRTITVLEQLVEVKGGLLWQPPKTRAGRRRITIPAFLADMLAEQLAHRALPRPGGPRLPEPGRKADRHFQLQHGPLDAGEAPGRPRRGPLPRPPPHRRGPRHRPGRPPEKPSRPASDTAVFRLRSIATGTSSRNSTPPWPRASTGPSGPRSGSSREAPKSSRRPPRVTRAGHA